MIFGFIKANNDLAFFFMIPLQTFTGAAFGGFLIPLQAF